MSARNGTGSSTIVCSQLPSCLSDLGPSICNTILVACLVLNCSFFLMVDFRSTVFNFCRIASRLCIIGALRSSVVYMCACPPVPLTLLPDVHFGGGHHGFAVFAV